MVDRFKHHWKRVPHHIRKTVVLIIGLVFIVAAPFTGVLPGPGGIPVFLIGIAILATEFEWAQRLRDYILHKVEIAFDWAKRNKLQASMLIVLGIVIVAAISYGGYHVIKK